MRSRVNPMLLLDSELSGLYGYATKGSPHKARDYILRLSDIPGSQVDRKRLHQLLITDAVVTFYRTKILRMTNGRTSQQLSKIMSQLLAEAKDNAITQSTKDQLAQEIVRLQKGGGSD